MTLTPVLSARILQPSGDFSRQWGTDAPRTSRQDRREATGRLLARAAATQNDLVRKRLRDEVVRLNMDIAESVASRFRNRGIPDDDLTQVACLGLVKAAQRFDPAYAGDFLSFAVPTIRGEVRRYFRDHGWVVRPPRHIQEIQARIGAVEDELTQLLGRTARPHELAVHLGEDEGEVVEALSANGCFVPTSLDLAVGSEEKSTLGERIASEDLGPFAVDARVILAPAVKQLSARDQRILYLRFFEGRNQREIGDEIGVTQMQVSRLLARILRDLRRSLDLHIDG
ncbi:MAG TPA: sigma-70 family RNA polymerase sigma factor [Nocardioides sp.]|jgi:RNA polymerase sigma-B factor|nr:sigma-70 family RNA polymerase sigma factor [Nocardioides sp.]